MTYYFISALFIVDSFISPKPGLGKTEVVNHISSTKIHQHLGFNRINLVERKLTETDVTSSLSIK